MNQCQCLKSNGKQCLRKVKPPQIYCFQHQNCQTPIGSLKAPKVKINKKKKLTPNEQYIKDDALIEASKAGQLEAVQQLLKEGADVHSTDDWALRWASHYGHLEVIKVLLKSGANVHAQNDLALRMASDNGYLDIVKVLLKASANVHAFDDAALKSASMNGHLEVAKELLKAGADPYKAGLSKQMIDKLKRP